MRVRELRVSYECRRLPGPERSLRLSGPNEAATEMIRLIGKESVEVCGLLCLSTRHDLLAYHELSRGTLQATAVHPRELFKAALLANAASVIVGHNHPSGDVSPSAEDLYLTRRLVDAGILIGIPVLDHLIVTADAFLSLRDLGVFPAIDTIERR